MSKTKRAAKSGTKSPRRAKSSPSISATPVATCDGCCTAIDDNEHDALQCEGSCQKWLY